MSQPPKSTIRAERDGGSWRGVRRPCPVLPRGARAGQGAKRPRRPPARKRKKGGGNAPATPRRHAPAPLCPCREIGPDRDRPDRSPVGECVGTLRRSPESACDPPFLLPERFRRKLCLRRPSSSEGTLRQGLSTRTRGMIAGAFRRRGRIGVGALRARGGRTVFSVGARYRLGKHRATATRRRYNGVPRFLPCPVGLAVIPGVACCDRGRKLTLCRSGGSSARRVCVIRPLDQDCAETH